MFRLALIALMLPFAAAAQTPPPTTPPTAPARPRIIVQFGHNSPVDAAAWIGDDYVISADTSDNSVLVWYVAQASVVDRQSLPPLGPDGLFDAASVRSITISPDGETARLVIFAYGPIGDNATAGARFTLDLDLDSRKFTAVGALKPIPEADVDKVDGDTALPALPASPDGKFRLGRVGNTLVATPTDAAAKQTVLKGTTKGYFRSAQMSPDGRQLARLVGILGVDAAGKPTTDVAKTRTVVWDNRTGRASVPFDTPPNYGRLRWIDDVTYAIGNQGTANNEPPTLIVNSRTGERLGSVPSRCMMTPVGNDGAFVAAGPSSCAAPPSAADGLWFFDRVDPAGKGFTLDRRWVHRDIPGLAGQTITALAAAPGAATLAAAPETTIPGKFRILAALRADQPVGKARRMALVGVSANPRDTPTLVPVFTDAELAELDPDNMIQRLSVSSDGRIVMMHYVGAVRLLDLNRERPLIDLDTLTDDADLVASDGRTVIVGGERVDQIQRFDAVTGKRLPSIPVSGVMTGGFLKDLPVFWSASTDGTLRFWDSRGGMRLLTYYSFPGNKYFGVMTDGRYDTNLGPDTNAVAWLLPDSPYQPLPAQAFMRSHYAPDLVRTLFGCIAAGCGATLKPLPDVTGINRVLPYARIKTITPIPGTGEVKVEVDTTEGSNDVANGKRRSGVHDLRLFRNGQLVAQYPDLLLPAAAGASTGEWRKLTAIPEAMKGDSAPFTRTFTVPIPSDGKAVSFSAYSFNEDRIKGFTGTRTYKAAVPIPPRPRRAIVVAIGVDATANPAWRLNYAANDARAMVAALGKLPGRTITPVLLTSTADADNATKANIGAVLKQLNGFADDADRAILRRIGIDPEKLPLLTPDDTVILAFSGHGLTIDGEFYMVPSDARRGADGKPLPDSLLSAFELTRWGRHVQASEIAMIIDACHSAASVGSADFKGGPMGDPGLGQLAFDKRIRILAATQADNVAMEDGKLGHGLLTYALVTDGLKPGRGGILAADRNGDGTLKLDEWLNYAVERLPVLADEIASGNLRLQSAPVTAGARMIENFDDPTPARNRKVQEPKLFDFSTTGSPVVVRGSDEGQP